MQGLSLREVMETSSESSSIPTAVKPGRLPFLAADPPLTDKMRATLISNFRKHLFQIHPILVGYAHQ